MRYVAQSDMGTRNEDPDRGARIGRLRKDRGYTSRKALSEALGVHPRSIDNWESGRAIDGPNLARLADLLGVTPGYLWTGQQDDEPADPVSVLRARVDRVEGVLAQQDSDRPVALRAHDKRVEDELAEIREQIAAGADSWARILTELRQLRLAVDELRGHGASDSRSGTAP